MVRRRRDVRRNVVERWGTGRMCSETVEVEWESTKYKGKRARDGFYPVLRHSSSDTYHWWDELSKCSLKYEPSVFNININVQDWINKRYLVGTIWIVKCTSTN